MALSDYRPATAIIKLPNGAEFSVKGITLNDLSELVRTHLTAARTLYKLFESGMSTDEVVMSATMDSPILVAHVIALASGEPGGFETAYSLPFPIQVEALSAIVTLTFESVGGPGNALAALTTLIRNLSGSNQSNAAKPIES